MFAVSETLLKYRLYLWRNHTERVPYIELKEKQDTLAAKNVVISYYNFHFTKMWNKNKGKGCDAYSGCKYHKKKLHVLQLNQNDSIPRHIFSPECVKNITQIQNKIFFVAQLIFE